VKVISKLLWLSDALSLARGHNARLHEGKVYARPVPDEGDSKERSRHTRRYKVICEECDNER